jgi:hypothetical protein
MVENRLRPEANFDAVVRHEKSISKSIGGRTVLDDRSSHSIRKSPGQLRLF